jgi:hypothetical protein
MVIKITKPFKYLKDYRVVLVTGCQRTGTHIASQMIAHDCSFKFIEERVFNTHQEQTFRQIVDNSVRVVIQCPAMMYMLQDIASDDIAIVVMHRDKPDVLDSMSRIRWFERGEHEIEVGKYGIDPALINAKSVDIHDLKYTHFNLYQRDSIPHVYDIQYQDLEHHVMWIEADKRKSFGDWQTDLSTPDVMIATLGYRHYAPAIASHIGAANYLQDSGIRFDWVHAYGTPKELKDPDGHEIVTRKYQQLREQFLAGGYKVFISIEDDMIIPEDSLTRLIEHLDTADVAYGLYCWRHSLGGGAWSAYVKVADSWGESVVIDKEKARQYFTEQSIEPVCGVGMGCTAIKRDVLEKIPFLRRGQACNDWYFAVDAQFEGYKQVCDYGLVCGHMTLDPTPRIIWPDVKDMSTMQRIDYL